MSPPLAASRRKTARRFGGELPLGVDPLLAEPRPLPRNVLAFSHGRAAISWVLETRGPFASAALSAYTCPSVPRHLAARGLVLGFFDHGDPAIEACIAALPARTLVLLPAPFGLAPWIDATALASSLGDEAFVLVDAAQSAFAHSELPVPPGGGVLSCPRKAMALGDGALLALECVEEREHAAVAALPEASEPRRLKQAGRALLRDAYPEREAEALDLAARAEELWPAAPHRMSEESLALLTRVDAAAHAARRRANAARLAARLGERLPVLLNGEGTPFHYPTLVDDRAALLERLRAQRVFATALWPDAWHDPTIHPRAAELTARLLALPVDQRYEPAEMDELADIVLACL